LVACFRRCYGETYPNDDFYDVPRLTQRIESGSLRSAIAIADDGTLVGHTGLTSPSSRANAVEAGNTVVDPACRGQGLLGQLAALLNRLCVEAVTSRTCTIRPRRTTSCRKRPFAAASKPV
jgi:predicted GNAT family N-acyltransferase